jgi:putative RNA 2'-phosphotransferase
VGVALKCLHFLDEEATMGNNVKIEVSKYVSYLLRHNPEDLQMDAEGFVELDKLVSKVRRRFPTADKKLLIEIVDESERKRFEIVENKIRALYGHTIPVKIRFKEDKQIARLYHGTTPQAAREILKKGLQSMRRRWVHLSPTEEIAQEVGKRRTNSPAILAIDASEARNQGIRFYRVTDKVYVCKYVPAKFIQTATK